MKNLKALVKRILYGEPKDPSVEMVERLRNLGMRIGERTTFFAPASCSLMKAAPG